MALRKPDPAAAASTPAGKFEDPDTPAGNAAPQDEKTEQQTKATPATPSASRAVAPKATSGGALSIAKGSAMKALEWAIPASDLENMSFGVFPRLTIGLDGISRDKDTELGNRICMKVLSWNPVWLVVHGEQNNAEANKLIRSSYDGVNLQAGEGLISDYLQHLRNEGYDKASVKQYVELYGYLLGYRKSDAKGNVSEVEVPEEDWEICQLSMSPQTVGQWQRFMLESGLRAARGTVEGDVVYITQNKKVLGPNKFGFGTFSSK